MDKVKNMIIELKESNKVFEKYSLVDFMKYCSVGNVNITIESRKREIVMNRNLGFVFSMSQGNTLEGTGELFGGKNHSTVIHGVKNVYNSLMKDQSKYNKYISSFVESFNTSRAFHNDHHQTALAILENQINKQLNK